jgi:hypothetical protein
MSSDIDKLLSEGKIEEALNQGELLMGRKEYNSAKKIFNKIIQLERLPLLVMSSMRPDLQGYLALRLPWISFRNKLRRSSWPLIKVEGRSAFLVRSSRNVSVPNE